MRFPSIAICTLTVLLAGAVTAHANDSIVPGDSTQESLPSEAGIEASNVTSKGTEVTAKLNTEAARQIIQPEAANSKPEFSQEPFYKINSHFFTLSRFHFFTNSLINIC